MAEHSPHLRAFAAGDGRVRAALAVAALALLLGALGCSAPARINALATAEAAEQRGDLAVALAAYRDAQAACAALSAPGYRQQQECADAYLQHAELIEHEVSAEDAAAAYERAVQALAHAPGAAATAAYRAGRLRLQLGQDQLAYTWLWRTVTDYPDQAHAVDAVELLRADGRQRNPEQLYAAYASLLTPLAATEVADALLYAMAEVAEHDLQRPDTALAMYDKLVTDYPDSARRDDAWWQGARIARERGDIRGAVRRLRALLATREVSHLIGSYFSVHLDDAQLALGRILRDELGDLAGAAAALARLPDDYPDSILIDDARFELARTLAQMDERARACQTLAELARRHPHSRYLREDAPSLSRSLGCASAPR